MYKITNNNIYYINRKQAAVVESPLDLPPLMMLILFEGAPDSQEINMCPRFHT